MLHHVNGQGKERDEEVLAYLIIWGQYCLLASCEHAQSVLAVVCE